MRFPEVMLRLLGLKRSKPKTPAGRIMRRVRQGLALLAVVYLLVELFPQMIFAHSVEAGGIRLYSMSAIREQAGPLLEQVQARLARSELYQPGDTFKVFVCNSKTLYMLLAPGHRQAFGVSMPVTDKIILADADLRDNVAKAFRPTWNTRSFTGVVTHEIGHSLVRHRISVLASVRLPRWLSEGYSEYLAGEGSYPEADGDRMIAAGTDSGGGPFVYLVYRRMVEYLIKVEGRSIRDLAADPPNEEEVKQKMRRWVQQAVPAGTADD
jgi:hypothetical protein